jgi:hypothetical protein
MFKVEMSGMSDGERSRCWVFISNERSESLADDQVDDCGEESLQRGE